MNSEFSRRVDNTPVAQTLNQAPESVLLVNAAGVIEVANKSALALFGSSEHEICGRRLAALFDLDGAARLELALRRVLADEPGSRMEEVRAELLAPPGSTFDLSLARMRHRDGVCVVATAIAKPADRQHVRMPRVSDAFFDEPATVPERVSLQPESRPSPQRTVSAVDTKTGLLPWNNAARRAAALQRRNDRMHEHASSAQDTAHGEAPAGVADTLVADMQPKQEEGFFGGKSDSANTNADMAERSADIVEPAAASRRMNWEPQKRDIYAEFETAKDQEERRHDVPPVSPAKLLSQAIQRFKNLAVSESLLMVGEIDDAGHLVPLDEELLAAMFEHLIERVVAVSPPYCEARVSLSPKGRGGFLARFSDIGRGLSQQELEAVFKQPELALGISHTGLVEAQQAAERLGLGFSISSGVSEGTTVEVSYDA